jgi:hypothetical protein
LPSLSSSIIFGSNSSVPTAQSAHQSLTSSNIRTNPPSATASSSSSTSGGMEEFFGLNEESVLPVLELVVAGLRTCPFLHELDLGYFAAGIASSSKYCDILLQSIDSSKDSPFQQRHRIHVLAAQVAALTVGPCARSSIEKQITESRSSSSS